MRGQNMLE